MAASEKHQALLFSPRVATCACRLPVRGVFDLLSSLDSAKIQHRSSICTQTHTLPLSTILLPQKLYKIRLSVMFCVSEIRTHPVCKTLPVSSYMKAIPHHIQPDLHPSLLYRQMFTFYYSSAKDCFEFISVLLLTKIIKNNFLIEIKLI